MEKIANLNLFSKINGKDLVLNQGEMGKGEKCITQREHHAMVTNNVTNRLDGSSEQEQDKKDNCEKW